MPRPELDQDQGGDDSAAVATGLLIRAADPPLTRLVVPRLWLAADERLVRLEWSAELARETVAGPDLLADFVKLADAAPVAIEGYARESGVLGINAEGRPGPPVGTAPLDLFARMWASQGREREDLRDDLIDGRRNVADQWWEPITIWHHVAARFRAVLRLAADLQDARPCDPGDIAAAVAEPTNLLAWSDRDDLARRNGDGDRDALDVDVVRAAMAKPLEGRPDQVLEHILNELIGSYPLRLRFAARVPGPSQLVIEVNEPRGDAGSAPWAAYLQPGSSLYPILVLRLAMAVWWPPGLLRCGWCGNPYPRPAERSPRRDRAHFCSASCRSASKQEQDRERARRRYAARRTAMTEQAEETGSVSGPAGRSARG